MNDKMTNGISIDAGLPGGKTSQPANGSNAGLVGTPTAPPITSGPGQGPLPKLGRQ